MTLYEEAIRAMRACELEREDLIVVVAQINQYLPTPVAGNYLEVLQGIAEMLAEGELKFCT